MEKLYAARVKENSRLKSLNNQTSAKIEESKIDILRSWMIDENGVELDELNVIGEGAFGKVYICDYHDE